MNEDNRTTPAETDGYCWSSAPECAPKPQQGGYRWNYSTVSGGTQPPEKKPKTKGLIVFLIIIGVLLVLTVCVFVGAGVYQSIVTKPAPSQPQTDIASPAPEQENTLPPASSLPELDIDGNAGAATGAALTPQEIYQQCSPFVVGVLAYLDDGYENMSMGSGVIMSADGYIMTNAHVVASAVAYDVVTPQGDYYEARLMGADSQTDIAVLKVVDGGEFPSAAFGDSDALAVGEMVAAIGNPDGLNLATTQTIGYISALDRLIETDSTYTMACIQTDAAINPGSSGGPLINGRGQVIGINSAKLADVDFEGIGFAIPINTALPVAKELILNGKVTGRAMLGIMVQEVVTPAMSEYYDLPTGLVIAEFSEGSGMAGTGAQVGDIVTAINGETISSLGECSDILNRYKPGETVQVELFHIQNSFNNTGERYTVDVVLSGS